MKARAFDQLTTAPASTPVEQNCPKSSVDLDGPSRVVPSSHSEVSHICDTVRNRTTGFEQPRCWSPNAETFIAVDDIKVIDGGGLSRAVAPRGMR